MRREHFEYFEPICPRCLSEREIESPLVLADVFVEEEEHIVEGMLHCPEETCRLEYPIIDGLPILVSNVRSYLASCFEYIIARDDLSPAIDSLLGDCVGPSTNHDAMRQQLSSYTWDHYAEFDPQEQPGGVKPGAAAQCLEHLIYMAGGKIGEPVVELGCATGRNTFDLAQQTSGLVLGLDVNFALLQLAGRVLRNNRVSYPRRRVGVVYERRSFEVTMNDRQRVDFWICDAMALPLRPAWAGGVVGMNLLDSVASPMALLQSIARLLKPGGTALLACPYDWSAAVTTVEGWIGGHSQRSEDRGGAEARLRDLLTPGVQPPELKGFELVVDAEHLPWRVRVHDRSFTDYTLHGIVARKR